MTTQTGDKPMVTPELLPCPFCGSHEHLFIVPDERGSGGQWVPPIHVGCSQIAGCGVSVSHDYADEAVALWNTRHREQETLSREQPLDALQRLGQAFDATPPASPEQPRDLGREASNWVYDIKWGPEGESEYAWVYDRSGRMIATMRTFDAAKVAAPRGGESPPPALTTDVRFVRCASCNGEFDEAEWDADTRCPECEQPKKVAGRRTVAPASPEASPSLGMGEGMFSPENVAAASAEVDRLQRELDITNADHIALWLEANTIPDEPMSQCISWLACRIVEAHERALAVDSGQPVHDSDTNKMIRRIMNDHAEYMNGVDRGQVRFGYQAVHSMIEAAIAETRAALSSSPDLAEENERLREALRKSFGTRPTRSKSSRHQCAKRMPT